MSVRDFLDAVQWGFLGYFIVLNMIYLGLAFLALFGLRRYMGGISAAERVYSHLQMPVSLVVPAYNEAATITTSIRALLQLNIITATGRSIVLPQHWVNAFIGVILVAAVLIDIWIRQANILGRLRDAVGGGDLKEVAAAAHALKGAAGLYSQGDAFTLARKIEQLGHEGSAAGIREAFQQLEAAIERLAADLRRFTDPAGAA